MGTDLASRIANLTSIGIQPPVVAERARQFGPYTLHRRLGAGGMATVDLASVRRDGAQVWVALKRAHLHLADDERAVRAFLNEASLQQRLNHPNVAKVLDYGRIDDEPYLTVEYLHGATLAELMRRLRDSNIRLPAGLVVSILCELLRGLHAAHELCDEDGEPLSLVHRDVTPQNVFLTFDGEVKLLDFGVARSIDATSMTAPGELKGKFAYMSPEQFNGDTLDRRSDVFSAGVVAWEAIASRLLYPRGDLAATLAAIVHRDAPPLAAMGPELEVGLSVVVQRALARPRAERWPTAAAFAEALRPYAEPEFSAKLSRISYLEEIFSDRISTLIGSQPLQALEISGPVLLPPPGDTERDQPLTPLVDDTLPTPAPGSPPPPMAPEGPTLAGLNLRPVLLANSDELAPSALSFSSTVAPGGERATDELDLASVRATIIDLDRALEVEPPTVDSSLAPMVDEPKLSPPWPLVENRGFSKVAEWSPIAEPAAPTKALPSIREARRPWAGLGLGLLVTAGALVWSISRDRRGPIEILPVPVTPPMVVKPAQGEGLAVAQEVDEAQTSSAVAPRAPEAIPAPAEGPGGGAVVPREPAP